MRYNILKKHSTRPERIFFECLKRTKIPFKHRWIVEGYEIDFLIGKYCIEIDGHEQDTKKNHILANSGYIPIHFHNSEVNESRIINFISNLKLN